MYFESDLDETTNITDGSTHFSAPFHLIEFYGFYVHFEATAIPQGSIYTIQVSGRVNKPSLDIHWSDKYTDSFVSITKPTIVEDDILMKWVRYKVVCGLGSNIENFYGVIGAKGQR